MPSHLGQASSVANYKSRVVVIHASNGAVATKLRQMAPTLLATFTQRGFECSGVQVRVHARLDPETARGPAQKPLSVRTTQELAALSDSLPLSPLRTALENLLTRSAKQE